MTFRMTTAILMAAFLLISFSGSAQAACTSPAGTPGQIRYDSSEDKFFGCTAGNGWVPFEDANAGSASGATCLGSSFDYSTLVAGTMYQCLDGDYVIYLGLSGSDHLFTTFAGFESFIKWKTTDTATAGTDSTTDGMANTNAMVTAGLANHPAGKACRDLGSQWFLPAKDQLHAMYTLSSASPLDAMVRLSKWYWSSTQSTAYYAYAWYQYLSSGLQSYTYKASNDSNPSVRCLRR